MFVESDKLTDMKGKIRGNLTELRDACTALYKMVTFLIRANMTYTDFQIEDEAPNADVQVRKFSRLTNTSKHPGKNQGDERQDVYRRKIASW